MWSKPLSPSASGHLLTIFGVPWFVNAKPSASLGILPSHHLPSKILHLNEVTFTGTGNWDFNIGREGSGERAQFNPQQGPSRL